MQAHCAYILRVTLFVFSAGPQGLYERSRSCAVFHLQLVCIAKLIYMQVAAEMINKKVLAWGKLLLNCNFYCLVVVPLPIHVEYHDPIHNLFWPTTYPACKILPKQEDFLLHHLK